MKDPALFSKPLPDESTSYCCILALRTGITLLMLGILEILCSASKAAPLSKPHVADYSDSQTGS